MHIQVMQTPATASSGRRRVMMVLTKVSISGSQDSESFSAL